MDHPVPFGNSPVKQRTGLGGIATIIAVTALLSLIASYTIDLFFSNIVTQEQFKIGNVNEGINNDTQGTRRLLSHEGDYTASIRFFGTFATCDHIQVSHEGFIVEGSANSSCGYHTMYQNIEVSNCLCQWNCNHCKLKGIDQTIEFNAPEMFVSIMEYVLEVPHYTRYLDEDYNDVKQLYSINGTILAPTEAEVFYGSLDEKTLIYFSLFNTIYSSLPGVLTPIYDLLTFIQPPQWTKPLTGITSQLLSIAPGSTTSTGIKDDPTLGVSVAFSMEVNRFILVKEQIVKVATLTFFAQLAALFGAVTGLIRNVLKCIEGTKGKRKEFMDMKKAFKDVRNVDELKNILATSQESGVLEKPPTLSIQRWYKNKDNGGNSVSSPWDYLSPKGEPDLESRDDGDLAPSNEDADVFDLKPVKKNSLMQQPLDNDHVLKPLDLPLSEDDFITDEAMTPRTKNPMIPKLHGVSSSNLSDFLPNTPRSPMPNEENENLEGTTTTLSSVNDDADTHSSDEENENLEGTTTTLSSVNDDADTHSSDEENENLEGTT
eukprot:CAMPEP_0117421014 /NCGR_PEP_ID=MMETSP0758-20121206/2217_1 /TAXON_ID=63605 /ORGANISM="Percolomonas cosmopolitus, Strain AE-1 (ATCC 50343)" /LENGTH=544 /DNA_ID=CAMNT_0005202937 /DNA_START=7653 /DNA_END=9283 /DNA_ORIENTATION=+